MNKLWSDEAWNDYMYWYNQGDKMTMKKINRLIQDIERNPYSGIGKPEELKYQLSGKWSRRINKEHRLIYVLSDNEKTVYIYSARSHYE